MSNSNGYVFDDFIDRPKKSPQELHRENLHHFLNTYTKQLDSFCKRFDDDHHETFHIKNNTNQLVLTGQEIGGTFFVGDSSLDPIKFDFQPKEVFRYDELLENNSSNKILNKVLLTFTALNREMDIVMKEAKNSFFPKLTIFGEGKLASFEEEVEDLKEEKKETTNNNSEEDDLAKADEEKFKKQKEQNKKNDFFFSEKQKQFGRNLKTIMNVWNFVSRVNILIKNVIDQFSQIFSKKFQPSKIPEGETRSLFTFSNVKFTSIFEKLSDTIGILISLDHIIFQNRSIYHGLSIYKTMIKNVYEDPERYGFDNSSEQKREIQNLLYLLQKIDGDILEQDSCFHSCCSNIEVGEDITIYKAMFEKNLKILFNKINNSAIYSQQNQQSITGYQKNKLLGFVGLYLLYFSIFYDNSDKKFFKQIWDLTKKIPLIHIYGSITFSPGEYLLKFSDKNLFRLIGVKLPQKEIFDSKKMLVKQMDQNLKKNVNQLHFHVSVWITRIESGIKTIIGEPSSQQKHIIGTLGTLVSQGVQLCFEISTLLKTYLFLHQNTKKPFTTTSVYLISRLVQMLKSIQQAFNRRNSIFSQHVSILTQFLSYKIYKILIGVKKKLEVKKQTASNVDQKSALLLVLNLLNGTPTKKKLEIIKLSLEVALQTTGQKRAISLYGNLLNESEEKEIYTYIDRIELLTTFQNQIDGICDCNFLYWLRAAFVPNWFQYILKHPENCTSLKFLFLALNDPGYSILDQNNISHLDNSWDLLNAYRKEILTYFEEEIVLPLAHVIENDLRLHIHSSVIGKETLSFKFQSLGATQSVGKSKNIDISKLDLSPFFKIGQIQFLPNEELKMEFVSIKDKVEQYLNNTFYNLTTISQNDWKTYEEMRKLAKEKYQISLLNVYLPSQTLEQGLDVLLITRRIHKFVSEYCYNLNTNTFVERCSPKSKSLHSVSIKHVSNSIRTHGTGIMNNTVNFVYKYLARIFFKFSQYLYDDHIKSGLIKEVRKFKELMKNELNDKQRGMGRKTIRYPLDYASGLYRDIKKLGVSKSGLNFMDQFRVLISEIGNALGYVRMVRSGGLHYIADAIKFVPDLDNIENFEELSKNVEMIEKENEDDDNPIPEREDNKLSDQTVQCGKNLYSIIKNLRKKFAEGSDYFKILEKVFHKELFQDKNNHLKNFYAIIPSLTLSFVDHMRIGKDKMSRTTGTSHSADALFTDDGFALGIAFILKILRQYNEFDSLHWFESIDEHYQKEMEDKLKMAAELKSKKNIGNEEIQTIKLTLDRIKSYKREFELLFFSFSGARVLFRD